MEIFALVVVAGAVGLFWYYNRDAKKLDINQDGRVDIADIKLAVENTARGAAADVVRVRAAAKKAAKKPAAKKPAAKKSAKKPARK